VSFATTTFCVDSQRMLIVIISLSTQSGNFWIHPRILLQVRIKCRETDHDTHGPVMLYRVINYFPFP
jgi:hypothetical protein